MKAAQDDNMKAAQDDKTNANQDDNMKGCQAGLRTLSMSFLVF